MRMARLNTLTQTDTYAPGTDARVSPSPPVLIPPGYLRVRFQLLCDGSDLVTKPLVGRVGGQPCMPNHLILKADQFARRFDHSHVGALFKAASESTGRGKNHVALRHGESRR